MYPFPLPLSSSLSLSLTLSLPLPLPLPLPPLSVPPPLSSSLSPQNVNHDAAYSAVNHLLPNGSLMAGGGCGHTAAAQLSPEMRDQLFHHQSAIAELLRHFWACFPILNPQLEEKVGGAALLASHEYSYMDPLSLACSPCLNVCFGGEKGRRRE